MLKPDGRLAALEPVVTVTSLRPTEAAASIDSEAVAVVAPVTVTGPNAPLVPPPTETPAPKLACVEPCTKSVAVPLMVTVRVCPCCPVVGEIEEIDAPGITVTDALFVLANATEVDVAPEMDTTYSVGAATLIEDGIRKVTRRVDPIIVVTAVAGAVTSPPPEEGCSCTLVLPGVMVPAGKPVPVTFTLTAPACPEAGAVSGESVTGVCA